jgi:N-acetylmuramoyl-L-alanine amidase
MSKNPAAAFVSPHGSAKPVSWITVNVESPMKRVFIFGLFLVTLVWGGVRSLHAQWDVVKYERNEYVTLRSFCKFYKLTYPEGAMEREEVTLKGSSSTVKIRKGSRSCLINGVRHWSTFNVEQGEMDWLISRKDVTKFFDPILRPFAIEGWTEKKGVVIDPGHGGDDRGAVNRKGIREKDCTLDTALRLEKVLKARGIATVMTRRRDVFIELEDRARIAAKYPDYIFVSIHYNDASGSARGIETYCFPPLGGSSTEYEGRVFKRDSVTMPGNEHDLMNIFLASAIHREITKLNPNDEEADRGVKRARFVVLKENRLPAVLIEGGFLSNRQESARISTPEYRQKIAELIANGIQFFFNRGAQPAPPPKPVDVKAPGVVPSTNQTVGVTGTNAVKSTPSIPTNAGTNSLSTVSTNKIVEPVKPVKVLPSTNSPSVLPFSTNSTLNLSMTNAPAVSGSLHEQPFTLGATTNSVTTPGAVTNPMSPVQELPPKNSPVEKPVEKPVETPSKATSPLAPRPEAREDLVPAHEEPAVEIYMQSTPQPRVPQVDLRQDGSITNAVPQEVKP